jgi:hypothetical protein
MSICLNFQEGEKEESGWDKGDMHLEEPNRGGVEYQSIGNRRRCRRRCRRPYRTLARKNMDGEDKLEEDMEEG